MRRSRNNNVSGRGKKNNKIRLQRITRGESGTNWALGHCRASEIRSLLCPFSRHMLAAAFCTYRPTQTPTHTHSHTHMGFWGNIIFNNEQQPNNALIVWQKRRKKSLHIFCFYTAGTESAICFRRVFSANPTMPGRRHTVATSATAAVRQSQFLPDAKIKIQKII